jgi:hypothetical protein
MTYVRNGRCFDEGSAEDFGENLSVAATEDENGFASQCLLAIELGTCAFGDGELKGVLTRSASVDEFLEQGCFERRLAFFAAADELAHNADEVVLRRRLEGLSARQRRVVAEEESSTGRGELKTLSDLDSLGKLVDVRGQP